MTALKTTGIVAEYNPFHNGHRYHLEETRKKGQADCIIAVMSGCFTQRGEPAIADKWQRAEAAVQNGVDLVLELPFLFACNTAEYFAKGAIRLLSGLGCIEYFSFGSEQGNLDGLLHTANILSEETTEFRNELAGFLSTGVSYPKARYEAVKLLEGEKTSAVLLEPNNILGVEYLKEWISLGRPMKPLTIERKGAGHLDSFIEGDIASATAIRMKLAQIDQLDELERLVPAPTRSMLKGLNFNKLPSGNNLFELIVYKILNTPTKELSQILSAAEGLENKLKKAAETSKTTEELVRLVKSKRYTETRIRRLLIHTLLNVRKDDFFRILNSETMYARVLGFSAAGAALLKQIKKSECSNIPVLTNINREERDNQNLRELLSYDILAADIYQLAFQGSVTNGSDHMKKPYIHI